MTNGSNMSVEPIHSFSAVLKGAFILILLVCSMLSYAQTFSSTSPYRVDGKVAPASEPTQRYSSYHSTIYEPFSSSTPSYGSNNDQSSGMSGRKNTINTGGFGTESDPNTSTESPIGEPWILLLFAAVAAAVVAWRQRRAVLRG